MKTINILKAILVVTSIMLVAIVAILVVNVKPTNQQTAEKQINKIEINQEVEKIVVDLTPEVTNIPVVEPTKKEVEQPEPEKEITKTTAKKAVETKTVNTQATAKKSNEKYIDINNLNHYKDQVPENYYNFIQTIINQYTQNKTANCFDFALADGIDYGTFKNYFRIMYYSNCYTDGCFGQWYGENRYSFYIKDFENLQQQSKIYEDKIASIVANFHSGTEKEILKQISDWECKNITYTKGCQKILQSSLFEGKAICIGYACTFKSIANYCGINVQFESGYYHNEYHSWNIVHYADGSIKGYDVTLNDSSSSHKWSDVNLNGFHSSHKCESVCFLNK